jgi:hypothetical protein
MRRYHHIGIPTTEAKPGETHLKHLKLFVVSHEKSEFGVEWMRFEADAAVPDLVRQDPQMGLAKLRIDIEQVLRAIHRIGSTSETSKRMPPLSRIINDLERSGNLSRDVATSLKEVLSIANRAVHGELVTAESAEMLSSLGVRLIEELWDIYKEKCLSPLRVCPSIPRTWIPCDRHTIASSQQPHIRRSR